MSIDQAIEAIERFQGFSLTESISNIEGFVIGKGVNELESLCISKKIDDDFMTSALSLKKIAGQINVIIHAAGILRSLPGIMEPGEVVKSVSLGAGNTGREFDLETNYRIAEYKFIDWKGGAESIRQNGIFKDFFELAEHITPKRKYLYVVGEKYPLKFLSESRRKLTSVLKNQQTLLTQLHDKYPTIKMVRDYYALKSLEVKVCDISPYIGRPDK